jgi:hypothetical protein
MTKNILNMKYIAIFCFIFAACVSHAQTIKLQEIKEKVAGINKNLPIETEEGAKIESIKIEEGYIVQQASRPSIYDRDGNSVLRDYGESFLEQAKNESARAMYEDYLNAGLGVKQVMFFKDVKKTETVTFSVSDLKKMLSLPASAYWQLLSELKGARKDLPMSAGDGLTCVAYEAPQYEFIYVYEVDENIYQIEILQKNLNKNKYKVFSELSTGKSDLFEMAKLCVNAGFGLGMKYIGKTSRKSAEMIMTYEELKVCFE